MSNTSNKSSANADDIKNKNNKTGHAQRAESGGQQTSTSADQRSSKACCFCWCCCCSCSWPKCCAASITEQQAKKETVSRGQRRSLTVKNNEENNARTRDNKLEVLTSEPEEPPSYDEVIIWGESFDKLMKCQSGRNIFRDFLKCEYSEENMLFWLACEDLKREENPEVVEEKARLIYEDYISILSPKEVSLDSRVREVINRNMVDPAPHTFDEAQLQIYTLMHRDSYPRFINSPMYKKLLKTSRGEAA